MPLVTSEGVNLEIKGNEYTVCGYTGNATTVTIPSSYQGKPITSLQNRAFFENRSVTSLVIPASVVEIGDLCFKNSSIVDITFERGSCLKRIGRQAFTGTSQFKHIVLPKSVQQIGPYCFYNTEPDITFEEGICLKNLSGMKVEWTDPTSVEIPNDVDEIPSTAFYGFNHLRSISFAKESRVKKIGEWAFRRTDVKSITLPKSVEHVGPRVFEDCKALTSIKFEPGTCIKSVAGMPVSWTDPQRVLILKEAQVLPFAAFIGWSSLEYVLFEEGSQMRHLKGWAFAQTPIKAITFPRSVKIVDASFFVHCNTLPEVTFEKGICISQVDGTNVAWSEENRLVIDDSTTEVGSFNGFLKLEKVVFLGEQYIKSIKAWAFVRTHLRQFKVPRNVEEIQTMTFWHAPLEKLTFYKTSKLKKIADFAFHGSALKTIRFPESLEEIDNSFRDSKQLTEIAFDGVDPKLKSITGNAFGNCPVSTISVPKGTKERLSRIFFAKSTGLDASKVKVVEYDPGVRPTTTSGKWELEDHKRYYRVIGYTGNEAEIRIPSEINGKEVRILARDIFKHASYDNKIQTLVIPASVTEIEPNMVKYDSHIKEIVIEKGSKLRKIGKEAFGSCNRISSFIIPKSVEEIGANFIAPADPANITFEKGTCIKNVAGMPVCWSDCRHLVIPKEIREIPGDALYGFGSLESVTFEAGSNVVMIGSRAFSKTGLKKFVVPKTVRQVGSGFCPSKAKLIFEEGTRITRYGDADVIWTDPHHMVFAKELEKIEDELGACPAEYYSFEKGSRIRSIGCLLRFCGVNETVKRLVIPRTVEEVTGSSFTGICALSELVFEEGTCIKRLKGVNVLWTDPRHVIVSKEEETLPEFWCSLDIVEKISFEEGSELTYINSSALFEMKDLKSIHLPASLEELARGCFYHCNNLTNVTFDEGIALNRIADMGISWNDSGEIEISNEVEKIPEMAFYGFKALQYVTFEQGINLNSIDASAFAHSSITSICIPASVQSIGSGAFSACEFLTEICFEKDSQLTEIGKNAFLNSPISSIYLESSPRRSFLDTLFNNTGLDRDKVEISTKNQSKCCLLL